MKKRTQVFDDVCPICGKISEVSEGSTLVMCPICAMRAADRVEAELRKASSEYDWRKTILCIKKKYKMGMESTVAVALGLRPYALSDIKMGKKAMPDSALAIIKEKYSDCIKMVVS